MLKAADNELLTRTGPVTPMGDLLRRYWIPVLLSEELPEPGCPPVRAPGAGRAAGRGPRRQRPPRSLEEGCPHRRASLFFGRNEGRTSPGTANPACAASTTGGSTTSAATASTCRTSRRPAGSRTTSRPTAYPAQERGGVIWVYMGAAVSAALRCLSWNGPWCPQRQRYVSKRLQFTNFAQAMEGGIDSSHVSFLHSDAGLWNPDRAQRDTGTRRTGLLQDAAPRFFIEPTDYGFLIGARRQSGPSSTTGGSPSG